MPGGDVIVQKINLLVLSWYLYPLENQKRMVKLPYGISNFETLVSNHLKAYVVLFVGNEGRFVEVSG